MADRVFCIDLGSAFTKVGLRRGRWVTSDVLADNRLTAIDDFRMCVPSVVAVDFSHSPASPIFGDAALDRRPGKTLRVFPNWKKELFAEAAKASTKPTPEPTPEPVVRAPSRLESLLRSNDFLQFAARYGINPGEVNRLHGLYSAAAAVLEPATNGKSAGQPVALGVPDTDAFRVAVLFFKHLRKTVLAVCASRGDDIPNPELIPARLSVPAFAPEKELPTHPGSAWLAEAMRRGGWSLIAHRPIVSEPYANAMGVLTEGSNCNRGKDMFRDGLLITCIGKPKEHPDYQAVVIDVGAFTVDFASLTYRSGGKHRTLDEIEFERREHSIPLGVSELDAAVLAVLPHAQVIALRDGTSAQDWMLFRTRAYTEGQPFPTVAGEVGAGGDAKRIEAAVSGYADKLVAAAREFMSSAADITFKELILTGGGCSIPAVREALISGAETGREKFRKIHLPSVGIPGMDRKPTPQQPIVILKERLTRGGTALGGSSVFFDMDREAYPLPTA